VLDDHAHRKVEPARRVQYENDQLRVERGRFLQASLQVVGIGRPDRTTLAKDHNGCGGLGKSQ